MKSRFSTLDICAVLTEINEKVVGMRLVNVYDIDHKTYLFKLAKPDHKAMLLVESGIRIHLSEFDWPKNPMPSNFSMKLRKHLRGRRLVSASQLGIDRIVDLQFGSEDASYHVFVELYDRGNIALSDCNDVILNLLRFRKDLHKPDAEQQENSDVKVAVHEPYPRNTARQVEPFISIEKLKEILQSAKNGSLVKRILNPHLPYGAACIEHAIINAGFSPDVKLGGEFQFERDCEKLHESLKSCEEMMQTAKSLQCKGYIVQKIETKSDGELKTNVEFHPFVFNQHKHRNLQEFESFNKAVDEFFGSLESQKNDMKSLQRERAAMRKLENVRKDHESRLSGLRSEQESDEMKAALIETNLHLVDQSILVVRSAIANQVDWDEIKLLVKEAQGRGDPVASCIKTLKLETNSMVMALRSHDDDDQKPTKIEIDLSLSAYANARKYYGRKRNAAKKEQKTIDASTKAFKSAEKKTKQTLKEAAAVRNILKARKVYWFEKFLWFISSENYLVIGGREAQQNEVLVKKYLNQGDIYVHADLHGATSCIIKNPSGQPIPPKTLNEAGTMATCHSAAWDAKVVTSAWWVHHDQVSKTAPSGEYLTTGSFLIRGKKNYLPPSYLVYGFGFLFKVDETCVWKHKGERRVRTNDDETSTVAEIGEENVLLDNDDEEVDNDDRQVDNDDRQVDNDDRQVDGVDHKDDDDDQKAECDDRQVDPGDRQVDGDDHKDDDDDQKVECDDRQVDGDDQQVDGDDRQVDGDDRKDSNDDRQVDGNDRQVDDDDRQVDDDDQQVDDGDRKVDGVDQQVDGDDRKDSDSDFAYPDTVVKLSYDINNKYQLDSVPQKNEMDDFVYLGDDTPVPVVRSKATSDSKQRISAKQRREQKKKGKKEENQQVVESKNQQKEVGNQQTSKRGQKKKLKKIREKYKDQDEEERQLKMELLQSAKSPKPKKEKNKVEVKPKKKAPTPQPEAPLHTNQDIKDDITKEDDPGSDEERHQVLKAEHLTMDPVDDIIDTLTGCPAADDIIMFAIPVCAPYNAMLNYKFKVKLTPGGGKKGKGAKLAMNMFQLSRDTTQHEKDHLRSVKDHDLSRNMPGKVKVSAPNIQKQKFKGKRR
uniref:nuclear export mediator factor NEMF isoform X2 n=1 Tax=Ciona intestinalis TaxID=7719 RepID=UPI000180BE15|nr:nuclear export mediator factor NEMF isoform X2 [Ciona intestinalis]|eukprot:XP_009857777.1 nuclear export mediator factor NEMF isoform X2 [Ciona intestinalis]